MPCGWQGHFERDGSVKAIEIAPMLGYTPRSAPRSPYKGFVHDPVCPFPVFASGAWRVMNPDWTPAFAQVFAPAVALFGSIWGTGKVLGWLERRQILDRPNERSSHVRPTPRGGGLAVASSVVVGWALIAVTGGALASWIWGAVLAALVLMIASWLDDRHTLPVAPRFAAHALAAAVLLVLLPDGATVFGGLLPVWADRVVAVVGWLWVVNLYNFMDGIDGITGVETTALGLGIALVAALSGAPAALVPLALICAAAAAGFLRWNWHPARIFLGDVGSIPLGLLMGGLLLQLAVAGQLAAAVILPLYYLADATITIGRRAWQGQKVWQAHRQHFYQRAVQGGRSHAQVVVAIAVANTVLVMWAVLSLSMPWLACAGAVATVAVLLARLQSWSKGARP